MCLKNNGNWHTYYSIFKNLERCNINNLKWVGDIYSFTWFLIILYHFNASAWQWTIRTNIEDVIDERDHRVYRNGDETIGQKGHGLREWAKQAKSIKCFTEVKHLHLYIYGSWQNLLIMGARYTYSFWSLTVWVLYCSPQVNLLMEILNNWVKSKVMHDVF